MVDNFLPIDEHSLAARIWGIEMARLMAEMKRRGRFREGCTTAQFADDVRNELGVGAGVLSDNLKIDEFARRANKIIQDGIHQKPQAHPQP